MDTHQCGTAQSADHSFYTSSLRIHAAPTKRATKRDFVIGPSFDRDRPTPSFVSPEECTSLFHPKDWAGRFLHNVGFYHTTRSQIPHDSYVQSVISVSLYAPCIDDTNVFLPNPYLSALHIDKSDVYYCILVVHVSSLGWVTARSDFLQPLQKNSNEWP